MDKYINKLIDANNRVIVPDFGAFIVKQLHPRTIVFNEFLRYNDGLLVDLLAEEEKLDKETARQKIADYVEEINKSLEKGQKFTITSLGTLAKEANGKITFVEPGETTTAESNGQNAEKETKTKDAADEQKKSAPVKNSAKKAEPVKDMKKEDNNKTAEKKTEAKPEIKKEENGKEAKKPEFTVEGKKEEIKTEEKETKKESAPQVTTSKTETTVKAETGKSVSKEPEVKKTIVTKETTSTVLNKPAEPVQPVEYQRRNNKTQIFILVALIVIVNGAIIYWFFFNDKVTGVFQHNNTELKQEKTETPKKPAVTVAPAQTDQNNAENAKAKDLKENTIKQDKASGPPLMPPKPKPAAKKVTVSNGKTYYIVAGCFKDEANADRLVKELQDKGYNAIKFGKIGQLYAVSYGSFPDKTSADNELITIRKSVQSDAWVIAR